MTNTTTTGQRRILVTGASRGIGRGLAIALAARGDHVVLAARDAAALAAVARDIRDAAGTCEVLPMDVTCDASVQQGVAAMLRTGPCDVLVNNAGLCIQADFMTRSLASLQAELDVNYWGALRVTRAVLPSMQQRRAGHVVSVSSLLGSIAAPTTANYSAAKAALEAWSQAMRGELAQFSIDVTVFVVPHTDTEMGRRVHFAGVHSLPVDYTVQAMLHTIHRRPRRYAASPVYRALLRLNRLLPVFMEQQLAKSTRPYLGRTTAQQDHAV